MSNYQYCTATNWGKGFITADDSRRIGFRSYPGELWRVPVNNQDANRWISGVAGVRKTLAESQAIVDAEITAKQTAWDDLPADQKAPTIGFEANTRPEDITLEE
jgi:hypothetical protein